MKPINLVAALLGGVSTLAFAQAANAQTNQAQAAAPASGEEIVVTGSRVITNGNNAPTPVTVLGSQELNMLTPSSFTDALEELPDFQGSRGQFSNPNTTGLYGGGNPATSELNLRNLSPQRTLILFDGQRVAPTNALGVVDVDMVPQELIQRVDVVTGGASAVYGSDAIAGVVNYITDTKFNGFKAEANVGESTYNDDQSWKAGFAAGTKFADGKGHIEVSFNQYDTKGIPHRNQRPYYLLGLEGAVANSTAAAGTAANPYQVFNNIHNSQNTYGGLITSGALKGDTFDTNGVLTPFVNGIATGTANSQIGGEGTVGGVNSLKSPISFSQLFVRLDYDLTDAIQFHTEAAASLKRGFTQGGYPSLNTYTYSSTNAFLPAAYQTAMGTTPTFTMSKSVSEAPLLEQISNVENIFINTGFDGKLGKYSWGVDFNYNYNYINDVLENNPNNQKLAAALDAVVNPATGQVVCQASLTNAAYSNCAPLNPFGPTAASAAAINYVYGNTTHYTPEFTQLEAGAHITGDLFNLPAGPVNGALSVEFRKQSTSNGSDATPTQFANCTGLRFNCSASTLIYTNSFAVGPTVSQTVKEGAFEFDAPILKDRPFFQSLNINGALRYTSYDFGGNNWTYKLGLEWHVNEDLTIRSTVSQDIEAPTLAMLFQPVLVAQVNNQDLLTLQKPTINIYNIGNPNLVSEVGHTTTAGFVWKPHFVPGFSVSLDAYHIIVDNALEQLQGYNPQLQQLCYASGGTSFYCSLMTRPGSFTNTAASNTVTAWTAVFGNVSSIETYGADLEVNYARRLFDHSFSTRILFNYQPHYLIAQPGAPTYDEGNVIFPNVVPLQAMPAASLVATANYGVTENLIVSLTERARDGMQIGAGGTGNVFITKGVPPYAVTDMNLSYKLWKPGNEVYFNIRNLFNLMPPGVISTSAANGYPQVDDPTGRYFTVGFRTRF